MRKRYKKIKFLEVIAIQALVFKPYYQISFNITLYIQKTSKYLI